MERVIICESSPCIHVTCPKRDGNLPVIILSHGAGDNGSMYAPLLKHWASPGFVFIAPTHADSLNLSVPLPVHANAGRGGLNHRLPQSSAGA